MTQEEKQLLLKDLCARLPYITYYDLSYYGHKNASIIFEFHPGYDPLKSDIVVSNIAGPIKYYTIKPYLRPMSSMTEEEMSEYKLCISMIKVRKGDALTLSSAVLIDWLCAHHLDFRSLIPKGLALEAPEGMYKDMTQEEARKHLLDWIQYVTDPERVPFMDEPCSDEEIILAMQIGADALSQPSLPSDLDEAAEEVMPISYGSLEVDCYGGSEPVYSREQMVEMFKAGAEWMAGQGETHELTIESPVIGPPMICCPVHADNGDKVVVQIRKK